MYMFKYVLKRFGLMLMSFFVIMTMCFVLIKMLPIVVDVAIGKDAPAFTLNTPSFRVTLSALPADT